MRPRPPIPTSTHWASACCRGRRAWSSLILPLADIYGINYVHLGIIFVANLELGFLHPPLGLNLLLASVRFKKPVLEVTWATLPMLGILAIGVLLITYWPWLTLGILHWMGRV